METWNPRYVAYAASTGMAPGERLSADKAHRPGASMCEFIIWIGQQWRAWGGEREFGRTGYRPYSQDDHAHFDAWLSAKWCGPAQMELSL